MSKTPLKTTLTALSLIGALAATSAASADEDRGLGNWKRAADEAVDDVMKYPLLASSRGLSGRSVFTVTIDRDGDVVESNLVENAGSGILKSAARRVLRNAEFPALPASYDGEELKFSLRLNYIIASNPVEARRLQREGQVRGEEIRSGTPIASRITILASDD